MHEAVRVLHAISKKYGYKFDMNLCDFGAKAYYIEGDAFPEKARKLVNEVDGVLKGPVGTNLKEQERLQRMGVDIEDETITPLRKELDTYLCYRPVVLNDKFADFSPLKKEVIGSGIDILMIRELVGGLYFGAKFEGVSGGEIINNYAADECTYKLFQVERFARACFEEARSRKSKLTLVHKANVLATSRYWNHIFDYIKEGDYQDITLEKMLVDRVAYEMVKNPRQFNGIMAFENMMGDIISDLGGGIIGSLGLMPSACINPETGKGYYEPSHGSAPDIAGRNMANPYSMIGSAAFMLDKSFGLKQESNDIWEAMNKVFVEGYRTRDLANHETPADRLISTSQFGDLVVKNILG
jgi:3-isopropylmalate dehydrogenase